MYTITGGSGTAILLAITSESKTLTSDVTSNSVESGGDVSDHAVAKPIKLDVSGYVDEAGRVALERLQAARDLVAYAGKDTLSSCVITSLKLSSSAKQADVYSVSVSLQEVRGVRAEVVPLNGLIGAKMSDQGGKTSSGTGKSSKKASTDGLTTTGNYQSYVNGYNSAAGGASSGSTSGNEKTSTGTIAKKVNQSLSKAAPTYSGYTRAVK